MKEGLFQKVLLAVRRFFFEPNEHLHCYCLGLDIVGYSKYTTDVQCRMAKSLQDIIEKSPVLMNVERRNLVFLPTGDGMIVCLLVSEETPLAIVQLAEHLQHALKKRNEQSGPEEEIIVRIGIHSGTGASYIDINGNTNIAGTVANTTQRVMASGKAWHIIASRNAFDDIATLDKEVQKVFHHIGTVEDKHKNAIVVYNVYRVGKEPFGNPDTPLGVQQLEKGAPTQQTGNIEEKGKAGEEVDRAKRVEASRAAAVGAIVVSPALRAKNVLRQCVGILKAAPTLESGLAAIRELQKTWNSSAQQVSVVINDRFALHVRPDVEAAGVKVCWWDEKSGGAWLYPSIKQGRGGFRVAQIRGFGDRLTAIAFEQIDTPACMVIAEVHYFPTEAPTVQGGPLLSEPAK